MLVKNLLVFVGLIFLLAASFFLAHIDLGQFQMSVGLFIGLIKAILIGIFFMDLHHSDGLHRVFSFAGIFIFGVLFALCMADYSSRDWLKLPGHFPQDSLGE